MVEAGQWIIYLRRSSHEGEKRCVEKNTGNFYLSASARLEKWEGMSRAGSYGFDRRKKDLSLQRQG